MIATGSLRATVHVLVRLALLFDSFYFQRIFQLRKICSEISANPRVAVVKKIKKGPSESLARIVGFSVQSVNHYTMGPTRLFKKQQKSQNSIFSTNNWYL